MTTPKKIKKPTKRRHIKKTTKSLVTKKVKKSRLEKNRENPFSMYWKRRAYELWSRIVRQFDEYKCCICGNDIKTQAHHTLAKEAYYLLSLDPRVGICLCSRHHKFGKDSAHKNGIFFAEWLKANRPYQYDWCVRHLKEFSKSGQNKENWMNYKEICEKLEEIEKKNLKHIELDWNN